MRKYHGVSKQIIKYDTNKYNFSKLVKQLYDYNLEELDSDDQKINLELGKDTHTPFHKIYYNKLDAPSGWTEFTNLYKKFIRDIILPLFSDDTLIYQKTPGIRFSRPGAKAVYRWHCDGDADHKHPPGEINIILPLTKCYGNNSIWVESIPGLGDYKPLTMDYGEFFIGYLNQQRHGNKTNDTGQTRVSFDFRVVPGFAYDSEYRIESCTTKQKFKIGSYYDKIVREKK